MNSSSVTPDVSFDAARLAPLFAALEADAPRHDFYQVLRQVDAAVGAPLGRAARPADEPLRLTQQASLTFAPASLAHCEVDAAGRQRLAVLNFGLFGPNGAMPLHLSEYLQERQQHHHDHTLARFCDMFQHRMILLFYRAWADCQAAPSLDRPGREPFGRFAASLAGLGQPTLRNRDSLPDHHKLLHVGHLADRSRHPQGLCAPLASLLQVPVALVEHCRHWLELSPPDRTHLGGITATSERAQAAGPPGRSRLGQGAIAGARVPDVQHRFRLRIGPLPLADFERCLPGRLRFRQIRDWVRNYLGLELAWDAQLVLRREQVPATQLGMQGQLGWTSWLGVAPGRRAVDADDVCLNLERLSRRPLPDQPEPETPHV